jgi:branched-chain amino acid transport system permease protein
LEFFFVSVLNGLSYGLLLFLLSAGLTLILGIMGVLNFAHASFYMLGAYLGYALAQVWGYGAALVLAPVLVGLLGAGFEHLVLRRLHSQGHVAELLVTFGLGYVVLELVQLLWGRAPLSFALPQALQGASIWLLDLPLSRVFIMGISLAVLGGLWWLLHRTRTGLVVQAAITHPDMVQALGHNVSAVRMLVFGVGSALAGLAGVMGGSTFVTEPAMAGAMGAVVFVVVVVGGMGSLLGAFLASLLIGLLQTLALSWDIPLGSISSARLAPALPFALMVLMLIWRPQGLLGKQGD